MVLRWSLQGSEARRLDSCRMEQSITGGDTSLLTSRFWCSSPTVCQTMQTLIRETVSGRKGSAPQTLYETGQLYAVGALRIACVGLQCVGFNNVLYRNVLEQAANLVQGSSGIRSGGSGWNAQARQISEIAVTAAAVGKKNPASGGGRDGKENS